MALVGSGGALFGGNNNGGNQQGGSVWSRQGRTYDEDKFMDGDITLTGNGFENIGEVQVGADQKIEFGQGNRSLQPMEQGRPYYDLRDNASTPAKIKGTVRQLHVSAQEGKVIKIVDYDSEALREATKSEREVQPRASRPATPGEGKPAAGQDDYLRLKLNASDTGNGTLSKADTTIKQPVTVHERN